MQRFANEHSVRALALLTDGRCLPERLTHFKQIIIFRDVHPQRTTGSHDVPSSAVPKMTDGTDVQLQRHQKLICNGKIYDLHLARRKLQPSLDARVPDGLQMMSGPAHGIAEDT